MPAQRIAVLYAVAPTARPFPFISRSRSRHSVHFPAGCPRVHANMAAWYVAAAASSPSASACFTSLNASSQAPQRASAATAVVYVVGSRSSIYVWCVVWSGSSPVSTCVCMRVID